MIFDECVNWRCYLSGNRSIWCQAFELIRSLSPDVEDGQKVIIPGRLYANIFSYEGFGSERCKIEAHRRFIDIQTLLIGEEEMGYQTLAALERLEEYNGDADFELFRPDLDDLTVAHLRPGNFVILFPGEGHTAFQRPDFIGRPVKKVVVKIEAALLDEPHDH